MARFTVPSPADAYHDEQGRSVCVVIPMPNDPPWELFDEIPLDVPIIVSDDSDGRLAAAPRANVHYLDYASQEAYAGSHYAAMPHRSAASRNIGHYVAWREGFDVIVALDYDCRTRPRWLDTHLAALTTREDAPAIRPVHAGGWVNTIDNHFERGGRVFARGYPYEWRADDLARTQATSASGRVALHMGVWDEILDLNGIDKLYGGEPGDPGAPRGAGPVADGNVPVCGMNTSFLAELTPAYYFLPDVWIDGWQLSRHDDIWGGYVAKKLMDPRGDLLSFGEPVVGHTKQTPLERVCVLEQWMHLLSMPFYDIVDAAVAEVEQASYAEMFGHFVQEYVRAVDRSRAPSHYRRVYRELGEWMTRWAKAFA